MSTKVDLLKNENYQFSANFGLQTGFNFHVKYNKFSQKWILDMYDSEQNPIFYGQTLIQGIDLLKPWRNKAVPSGILILYDNATSGTIRDITYENVTDFSLYYIEG